MALHNSLTLKTLLGSKVFSFFSKVFDDCCGGMSSDGNPDLVLNQQGNWVNSSGIIYHEVTYLQLTTLISNNQLEEGDFYLITDFKTRAIIQFTGDLPSGVGNELVQEGELEPLLVQALSNSVLSETAQSISYPQDKILYRLSPLQSDYDYQVPDSLGVIYYRQDQDLMISREYDWRNIIFRRWETVIGNGIYTSISPVVGADFVDYAPYENCTNVHNTSLMNSELTNQFLGLPYQLDNTILKDFVNVYANSLSAFGNTFIGISANGKDSSFFSNNIVNLLSSTLKLNNFVMNHGNLWNATEVVGIDESSKFSENSVGQISSLIVSGSGVSFSNNIINLVDSLDTDTCNYNSGVSWVGIVCTTIYQNDINTFNSVIIEEVSNNILNNLTIHSNTLSGAKISGNVGNQISDNSSFRIRDNNVTYITNNNDTPDSAQKIELNVGTYIIDCGASIYENNVSTIAGCYNTGVVAANIADSITNINNTVGNVVGNITNEIGTCTNLSEINNNILTVKIYGVQGDNTILKNNTGQQLNGVETAGDFIDNNGVNIGNSSIISTIQNNTFNGFIGGKTVTPTASIQATTPSVVKYDVGLTEFVEEILTSGVVTYSAAITS